MIWSDSSQYPYEEGSLFLGLDENNNEVGIKTERHALTIAGAGAGKGAAVIIPNLLKWPHNALVIDPKGEAAEATAQTRADMGQAVHVVDPFGSSRVDDKFRASYNPLDDLDPDSLTIREDIETIADGIVMRGDAQASHWDDGAQAIISGLIAYVVSLGVPEICNLITVRQFLADEDKLAEAMHEMKNLDACAGLCREAFNAASAQEGRYFVSNAQKNTRWLDSRGMAKALASSSFSLADLKTGRASVYLVLPANYLGQHGRFLRLFVRCGIEAMARKSPAHDLRGQQCLFLLDEFFSLGYIDEIAKAAGLMRGYGLQLWPILQDLGQLITLYGREGSETFFANADVHQFFGNTDQLTLEQISTRVGVTDLSEIPLPPTPPTAPTSGFYQGIGAVASKSKNTSTKVLGAAVGGAMSMTQQIAANRAQQRYQEEMNEYQRDMARHGRPRVAPDEVALLVQKKKDVVADNMICLVYGREPLLIKLAPYFRTGKTVSPEPPRQPFALTVIMWVFITLLSSIAGWIAQMVMPVNFNAAIAFGAIGFLYGLWSYLTRGGVWLE